ncbi:unnamed protein product, partial [Brenthis ino]
MAPRRCTPVALMVTAVGHGSGFDLQREDTTVRVEAARPSPARTQYLTCDRSLRVWRLENDAQSHARCLRRRMCPECSTFNNLKDQVWFEGWMLKGRFRILDVKVTSAV